MRLWPRRWWIGAALIAAIVVVDRRGRSSCTGGRSRACAADRHHPVAAARRERRAGRDRRAARHRGARVRAAAGAAPQDLSRWPAAGAHRVVRRSRRRCSRSCASRFTSRRSRWRACESSFLRGTSLPTPTIPAQQPPADRCPTCSASDSLRRRRPATAAAWPASFAGLARRHRSPDLVERGARDCLAQARSAAADFPDPRR